MAKQDIKQLTELAGHLFTAQWPMLSLYQTLSDHFYPERSDFTVTRNVGQELADSLVDSYPVLVRRDLCNSFGSMLRDGEWFNVGVDGESDHHGKMWLEFGTHKLRKLMNNREANFVRATKEGDHDYGTFGQCALSVERNRKADGLLYRCWHLRDMAWSDGCDGHIELVARKWKPTYWHLKQYFANTKLGLHESVARSVKDTPFKQADIRHIVIPSEMYGDDEIQSRFKYVSLYIDVANNHLMEEVGMHSKYYVIPRFQTIAGSPYAYSPATVVGLPDARALQAMTYTLLEAGERYARPPIIATQKVIRGDVDLSADGITWVDKEYDEKMGAALRTLPQDRGGFPIGEHMRAGIVDVLASAFYLNKITLPETTHEMTAYEVQERMKQYRRENLPLFAPIEAEYNAQLCEASFDLAMANGMLGSPYDIPESLQGKDVMFKFESPLSQSEEEKKVNQFSQVSQLLAEAADHDDTISANVNLDVAFRDAVNGMGAPSTWLREMEQVLNSKHASAMQEAMQKSAELARVA